MQPTLTRDALTDMHIELGGLRLDPVNKYQETALEFLSVDGRKLAERACSATKEIGGLISGMQRTVAEAVRALDEGAVEVDNGAAANQAGSALADILQAAQAVQEQAAAALEASEQMGALSAQLVGQFRIEPEAAAPTETSAVHAMHSPLRVH